MENINERAMTKEDLKQFIGGEIANGLYFEPNKSLVLVKQDLRKGSILQNEDDLFVNIDERTIFILESVNRKGIYVLKETEKGNLVPLILELTIDELFTLFSIV